ncbi:MAG: hypothetical protein ACRDJN_14400 [Chloroflexota bacterium]
MATRAREGGDSADGEAPVRVKAVIERDGRYLLAQHNNRLPENLGKPLC